MSTDVHLLLLPAGCPLAQAYSKASKGNQAGLVHETACHDAARSAVCPLGARPRNHHQIPLISAEGPPTLGSHNHARHRSPGCSPGRHSQRCRGSCTCSCLAPCHPQRSSCSLRLPGNSDTAHHRSSRSHHLVACSSQACLLLLLLLLSPHFLLSPPLSPHFFLIPPLSPSHDLLSPPRFLLSPSPSIGGAAMQGPGEGQLTECCSQVLLQTTGAPHPLPTLAHRRTLHHFLGKGSMHACISLRSPCHEQAREHNPRQKSKKDPAISLMSTQLVILKGA